jgi:hypothetical protein
MSAYVVVATIQDIGGKAESAIAGAELISACVRVAVGGLI